METNLQSKEVKIPKQSNNKSSNSNGSADIDFKSSFARSLSNNNHDDDSSSAPCFGGEEEEEVSKLKFVDIIESTKEATTNESDCNGKLSCDKNNLNKFIEKMIFVKSNESFNNKSDEDKERQLWTDQQQFKIDDHSTNDAEIFRLRKQCQNLLEENRKLYASQSDNSDHNVANVVLQTKVETLQWQLRQVENSRQMYRAIMEEVGRFLEKCHINFEQLQHHRESNKIIERSKSIANIMKSSSKANEIQNRARSTINLSQDSQKKSGLMLSELSYNTFKDFTWRRNQKNKSSEKKAMEKYIQKIDEPISLPFFDIPNNHHHQQEQQPQQNVNDAIGIDAEKLSKEAFRLSRTVHNFLNTHEPILSQTIISDNSSDRVNLFAKHDNHHHQPKSDFLFGFDHESHMSLRSTDESSVHSSSNSSSTNSNKEDEDPSILPKIPFKNQIKTKVFSSCHQTEDESGFSSMNSFHEVGLPLHSTFLSTTPSSYNNSSADESHSESAINNNKLRTTPTHNNNKKSSENLLETTTKSHLINHRKYDSVPITLNHSPPKLKLLDEDKNSMKVLWV